MMDSRFLIIARVGDHSQHAHWLQGERPKFDLFINYTGATPARFKDDGTFYEQSFYEPSLSGQSLSEQSQDSQDNKWPALAVLLASYWELISTYDAVWFPSDHLLTTSSDINRLFHLFDGHQLALAEPVISTEAKHTASLMRFVSGIGTIAPLFSRDNLAQQKANFAHKQNNSQRAMTWSEQTPNPKRNQIAIIDAVSTIDSSVDRNESLQPAIELYGQYIFQ
ncbi:MAG: hypothetical protein U5M23_14555 [Marinagarivorans sp.]|nr:hypothetical protein [Marinagarivorans sp.]